MACVLGGTYTMGFAEGRPDEREPGEVYVDTFYMDLTEVTNEAFEECIAAGACTRPMPFRHFGGARQPVVAVSWFDAVHHCERIGKRLPTDAEWERAASGPDHTQYPWGNEPAGCERANIMDERGEGCGTGRTHDVVTGVALRWEDETHFALSVSKVTIASLTRTQIKAYVATGETFDKAGGYGIQGRAAAFVTRLDGSYSGVMGLPLAETAGLLAKAGFPLA